MALSQSQTMEHPHFSLFTLFLLHATLLSSILNSISLAESASHVFLNNETDQLALLAFKDGIYDHPNQVLSSWNHSFHFCTWVGVTCSKRHPQRVMTLNLPGLSLAGSLSPHIGNLSFLRCINLSRNSFQGLIPHEIGHLSRLHNLDLNFNSFRGEIPSNLTNCLELRLINLFANKLFGKIPYNLISQPKLRVLDLGKNNLTGLIPPSLGNLSSLVYLYLSRNKLHGSIPDDLSRILNLQVLAAHGNELSGLIPSSLYNHSSIEVLDLGENNLHGSLPQELGLYLLNLEWFSLSRNHLTGPLPNSLGNASRASVIALGHNNFTGLVPMNLGSLQRLKRLMLGPNQLTGDLSFIQSLTNCTWLEYLTLAGNKFNGMLPNSIANLSIQMEMLDLSDSQIFGTIPKEIGNLASLSVLDTSHNLLTGKIPSQLGNLHKLEIIYLDGNRLSGQIPESLGNLSKLSRLSLPENELHGGIPSSIGNCQNLLHLILSNNKLSGSIPHQVLNAQSIVTLDMGMNSLNGSLHINANKLKNLVYLDVSNNKLSGEIPTMLSNCLSLEYFDMEENMFEGIIPSSFTALKGIQTIDLARNNLSGQIPKFLEILPHLRSLNLSFNNLEGEVPMHGIFQNSKAFSISGNDRLCGGIPTLKLPSCPKQASMKKERDFPWKVIILIVVLASLGIFLLLSVVATRYCLKRQSGRATPRSSMRDRFLDVTYEEILRATEGFSSANLIGEGSYGCVYKGFINRIEKTVAVKVLKLQRKRTSKSFKAECNALKSIQHRNIVKVLTVCSSIDFSGNDFKAFIFEYMPNGNLDMWLYPNANGNNQLRNLNFAQRMNIAIDVACALDYLHHHCHATIVHCDLKPSNVLLDDDMVAHVSDFGLAKLLFEDVANHTQSSSLLVKGSIGYAAPEYGMGGDVSIYGDVYSYGILLLELFTGKKPTDDMFKDNLNLHQFAKLALPNRVMEIIDHRLLLEEAEVLVSNKMRSKLHECLTALVSIGMSCSSKLPKERMEMNDILKELERVREFYLGVRKNQNICDRASLLIEGP